MKLTGVFRRSIAVRTFALLAGIFLLTYFSISAIVLTRVRDHLQSAAVRSLIDGARLRLASVQRLFAQQAINVRAWARLDEMNDLVTDDIDGRVGHALRQLSRDYSIPGTLYAFDRAGRMVASSAAVPHSGLHLPQLWFPDQNRSVRFIDKSPDPYGGEEVVAFSAPVYATYAPRMRIGTLVLVYRWTAVKSILSFGNVHLLVARSDDVPIFSAFPSLSSRAVRQALDQSRVRLNGQTYSVSRVRLPAGPFSPRWKVAVVTSGAGVAGPIHMALDQIALLGVVLTVPMALLIGMATRRLIEPIRRLTIAADEISRSSDTSRRVEVDRADEIGALQEAFNRMIARQQEVLEKHERAVLSVSQLNESLQNLAMTDALTGLPNRRAAESRLKEEFAAARRAGASLSIALFDLDHFKAINDRYGHDAGDFVLQHCAGTLRGALRAGDWVARWGGEEFLMVFRDADLVRAYAAAERVCHALGTAVFELNGAPMTVRASGGLSALRETTRDLAQMLSEADHCLYGAKRGGRDRVVHAEQIAGNLAWKTGQLREALLDSRVVPAYQVIVDLASGRPVAEEVLARIVLPDGRIATAGEFIDAAEDINLAHSVDTVITRQAIARCAGFADGTYGGSRRAYFLNLSPQFLAQRQNMVELLEEVKSVFPVCAQTGAGGASPIVLEIAERPAFLDIRLLREELQPLLDFGCRIALDDFGSGFSSFLYLAELPVSFIKIEGWMVRSLNSNKNMLGIIQSIAALADELGIITIAESVEDAATAQQLREIGITWGQGYYFGMPQCAVVDDRKVQTGMN